MNTMLRIGILLVILSGAIFMYYLTLWYPENSQSIGVSWNTKAFKEVSQIPINSQSTTAVKSTKEEKNFIDKSVLTGFPQKYPRIKSVWQEREKVQYTKLLARNSYEMMVVPFQVHGYALDRTSRSLMTAELTYALKERGHKVPDPYLVFRALGENERQFDPYEVIRLAKSLGIKHVIWAHVGHGRDFKMKLIIQKLATGQVPQPSVTAGTGVVRYTELPFSEDQPPIEVFHLLLPEILSLLDPSQEIRNPEPVILSGEPNLSASPIDMFSENRNDPLQNAYIFQFLAYLTPEYEERTRERFMEKSLLEIYMIPQTTSAYRVLKARAYMQFGLRPAAIHLLSNPETSVEKALLATLNGNLPDLKELANRIEPGMNRMFAMFDVNTIAAKYHIIEKTNSLDILKSLELPGAIWPFLASRALTDWDSWSQFENLQLKQLLDLEFPVPGFTADGIIGGALALGDESSIHAVMNLSVTEHIKKLMNIEPERWCCEFVSKSPNSTDYLDLITAIATGNLMRRAKYLISTQGLPSEAKEYLNSLLAIYEGNPEFTFYRSMANFKIAQEKLDTESENLHRSAYRDLIDALYWAGGQTRIAANAFFSQYDNPRQDFGRGDNPYAADYPYRPYYSTWESGGDPERIIENSLAALSNSSYDFSPVWVLGDLLKREPERMQVVLVSIRGRFAGNPEYGQYIGEASQKGANITDSEKSFRDGIEANPEFWPNYMELGDMLVENCRIQDAYNLFMSWPRFVEETNTHRVERANSAYEAGNLFYWSGNFELAIPLYRMAADLQTGSESSMASEIRLHILNEEYDLALQGMLNRAHRYNSSYAYRDYLGMLHVFGKSKESWDAFNALVNRPNWVHLWEAALAGHRLQSATEADVAKWVKQYKTIVSDTGDSFAAIYLLRAGVIDRTPSERLTALIDEIDQPVWRLTWGQKHVFRSSVDDSIQYIVGTLIFKDNRTLPLDWYKSKKNERIKSDLAYFAESYRAIRLGEFEKATNLLAEATGIYNTGADRLGYLLPYYAYAAARSGKSKEVRNFLEKFDTETQRFDYHLAEAILDALDGDDDQAIKHLDLARYRRPHTESRPLLTEYQYAEICEFIFEATQNELYKKRLLDWSRKAQQFFPWYAWSYPMIAKYSDDEAERRRSIVIGHYLDSESERLGSIPDAELQNALKSFSQLNPFQPANRAAPQKQSI